MIYRILSVALLSVLIPINVLANDIAIFGADWCGPCISLKKFLPTSEAAKEYTEIQIFDIDEHREAAAKLGITKVPTSIIFDDDGKIKSRRTGFDFGGKNYEAWLKANAK